MNRSITTLFFLLLFATAAVAQDNDKLFGPGLALKSRKGFILTGNADFDLPAADMARRFGSSYRLGPGVLYKTESNWLFGAKFDFILGNVIKVDSLMINITDKFSAHTGNLYEFINNNGDRAGIPVYERGYAVGLQAGRIFTTNKQRPDNGIMLITTAGFMQYRLNIFDRDKAVPQLSGNNVKGYDRLTNGMFLEQYAGYVFFSKSRLINFTLGVDGLIGFTQGRRDYLYDVMRPDNGNRIDILFGVRGGWFIPIFKRKSEEILFQ